MSSRRTYLIYFGFLAVVLIVVGYSARNVVFRPWTARNWVSITVAEGHIFLFGGRNEHNELTTDVLSIDPAANTLRHVGREPHGLFGCGAATLDGQIYVAGGTDNKSISARIDRFDPRTRSFTPIGHLPGPRSFGALVSDDNHLYYLGGWDGTTTSADIIEIDPSTGTSRIVGRLPHPLEQFASATVAGVVYLIGGMNQAGDFVRAVYGLELPSGRVVAHGELATAAARMTATSGNGEVYVAGGWNGASLRWLYGFRSGTAEITPKELIELRFPVLDTSLAAVGNELYLLGGQEQRFRRQIQVLRINPHTFEVHSLRLKSYAWS